MKKELIKKERTLSVRLHKFFLVGFLFFLGVENTYARKFQFSFGGYSVSAKTSAQDGSLSGLGFYRLAYYQQVLPQVYFNLGYSLIMSQTLSGDMSFGLDVGAIYFPLSQGGVVQGSTSNTTLSITELWRPYIGLGFVERRFESVSSNYAGFNAVLGVERELDAPVNLSGEIRYSSLYGASQATATEMAFVLGMNIPF